MARPSSSTRRRMSSRPYRTLATSVIGREPSSRTAANRGTTGERRAQPRTASTAVPMASASAAAARAHHGRSSIGGGGGTDDTTSGTRPTVSPGSVILSRATRSPGAGRVRGRRVHDDLLAHIGERRDRDERREVGAHLHGDAPSGERDDAVRLPRRHERVLRERGEAVVEQRGRVGERVAGRAQDDRDQPSSVPLGGGDHAVAGLRCVAGLDAGRALRTATAATLRFWMCRSAPSGAGIVWNCVPTIGVERRDRHGGSGERHQVARGRVAAIVQAVR